MTEKEHIFGDNEIYVQELIPETRTFSSPLVFVHGVFSGAFSWEKIAGVLVEKGFHCISLSLRGHKPSKRIDMSDVGLEDYLEDIDLVLEELEISPPVLVGHSLGGLLSLMYGFKESVQAIVALDPALPEGFWGSADREEKIRKMPELVGLDYFALSVAASDSLESLPDISIEDAVVMHDKGVKESGKSLKQVLRGVDIDKQDFGGTPILVIGVELDDVLPISTPVDKARDMAEHYNADFLVMPDTTHPGIIIGDNADKTAEIIADWLGTQEDLMGVE